MAPVRRRAGTIVGLAGVGFVLAVAVLSRPAGVEDRLPQTVRLADLIAREQATTDDLRQQADELRTRVDRLQRRSAGRSRAADEAATALRAVRTVAGLTPLTGPGLRIELRDAVGEVATTDVNDLVIHSSDVQAVVNAAWRAGAEAVAINGERLVSTSAVLCVGNTLLLNGTVHSPPYVVVAIGATRDRFEADSLVARLRSAAATYGIGFSVADSERLVVPAYEGAVAFRHVRAM